MQIAIETDARDLPRHYDVGQCPFAGLPRRGKAVGSVGVGRGAVGRELNAHRIPLDLGPARDPRRFPKRDSTGANNSVLNGFSFFVRASFS